MSTSHIIGLSIYIYGVNCAGATTGSINYGGQFSSTFNIYFNYGTYNGYA